MTTNSRIAAAEAKITILKRSTNVLRPLKRAKLAPHPNERFVKDCSCHKVNKAPCGDLDPDAAAAAAALDLRSFEDIYYEWQLL